VSFSTAKYFDTRETPLRFNQKSAWLGLHKGLGLVMWGCAMLVTGGTLGLILLWQAGSQDPLLPWLEPYRSILLLIGVLTLALTGLLSYGLILIGQWRCLMNAPQQPNTREFLHVCLYSILLALILNVMGVCLDGSRTYAALQRGGVDLATFDAGSTGNLLQAGAAGLGLFSSLLFSQFLRNVARCFNARNQMGRVDTNLAFVALLLGGSIGTLFWSYRAAFRPEVLPWLLGGWLACVVWHLVLVSGVRGCVAEGLSGCLEVELPGRVEGKPCEPPAPKPKHTPARVLGVKALQTLSGLRRLAKKAN
jgi:hypothetical protein